MDNSLQQPPKDQESQPSEPENPKRKRNIIVIMLIVIILGVLASSGIFLVLSNQLATKPKATPSPTPPAGCYYKHNPLAQCVAKDCDLMLVCPTPGDENVQEDTTNWKTYTNPELNFSINIPADMSFYEEGWKPNKSAVEKTWYESWTSPPKDKVFIKDYSRELDKLLKYLYSLNYYDIQIEVRKNAKIHRAYTEPLPLTYQNLQGSFIDENTEYNDVQEVTFLNRPAVKLITKSSVGSLEYQFINGNDLIRIWGTTYNLNEVPLATIDQILQTFKFTDSNYSCPATTINCMPPVSGENQKFCSEDYLNWAKENCPKFQDPVY